MASSFRTSKWDPILIVAQMAAVQSLTYLLFSFVLYIALTLNGTDLSLDLIFNDQEIRTDTGFGWSLIIVWLVNAFLSIAILMMIVQRAKLILDFVLTFHFFHTLLSWRITGHFPSGLAWWILQLLTVSIMTLGGEWACMHREMKPILISKADEAYAKKRKVSDVANRKPRDQGPLLSVVGKAKEVLIHQTGKRNGKQVYDPIPLYDVPSTSQSTTTTTQ